MAIPITREIVSPKTEEKIRERVRRVSHIDRSDGISRIVTANDADAMLEFFSLPEVSGPIYTIEKPVTRASVAAHIERKSEAQVRGEGLLTAMFDEDGRVVSYMDHLIWPQWSAAEFGGAMRPERQSAGQGRSGIVASIDWVFDALGINLLCFTASPDNHRSVRLIEAMGMRRMGEVESLSPNGQTRQSLVWEMTKAEWTAMKLKKPNTSA